MARGYRHLTYEIRCQIYALNKSGLSQETIAEQLYIDQSSVSREMSRNKGRRGYRFKQAHQKAMLRRHKASAKPRKMTPEFIPFMEQLIREKKRSPEQISGRLRELHNVSISHESMYQYIWKNKKAGGDLYKNLRHRGKKYNKRGAKKAGRGLIPERVGIENRPLEVVQKTRVGDWEGDTIVGSQHRGAIVSMVERKTKIVRLSLISGANAEETTKATIEALAPFKDHVHTITTDNGKEFAQHKTITKELNASFYFANPYHSWERGLNENTNGLVRQFFPKGTDFTKITQEQVRFVEENLNNRPRKLLNYRTPNEEFLRLTGLSFFYALQC
jgi:IS30 family transposase